MKLVHRWNSALPRSLSLAQHILDLRGPDLLFKFFLALCKAIEDAKKEFWTMLESQGDHVNTCRLWLGLQAITCYKVKSGSVGGINVFPP